MTDNKARRVSIEEARYDRDPCLMAFDDPSGTHMIVPVEVWEMVVNALKAIKGNCEGYADSHAVGAYNIAHRALAEIGGGDG